MTDTTATPSNNIWHVCLTRSEPLGGRWDELLGVDEPALHQAYGFLSLKGVEKVKAKLQALGFDSVWTESNGFRSMPISYLLAVAEEYKFYIDNSLQPVEVTVEDLLESGVDLCDGYYHNCHPITNWGYKAGTLDVVTAEGNVSLDLPCVLFHA